MGKLSHNPTSMLCIAGQSRSGTVIIVDFADAYFHIRKALVNIAAAASDLYTIGTMTWPGAINVVQTYVCSRLTPLQVGMTYDHTPLRNFRRPIYGLPESLENRFQIQG